MSTMERPAHRPRSKSRTFSFRSDKSHPKEQLSESAEDKRRSHFSNGTKANPNAAMNEAQPVAAALEASTIGSLRSLTHSDSFGNPIAEPDLSNPTRPRWERPLDTIRAFEAAIDTDAKRRSSIIRSESTPGDIPTGYNSRRSSYYGGYDQNPRYSQAGYYGSRSQNARDSYLDNSYGAPPTAGPSRNRFSQRLHSEPHMNRYSAYGSSSNNIYPTQGYQQSRDTVNTGASSGSEPWANNTDPSSDNSSIERTTPPTKQPEMGEQYGFNGFGGAPILEEYSGQGEQPQPNGKGGYFQPTHRGGAPAVPAKYHNNNQTRHSGQPQRLNKGPAQPLAATSGNAPAPRPALDHQNSDKRKSWFKRRFSSKA